MAEVSSLNLHKGSTILEHADTQFSRHCCNAHPKQHVASSKTTSELGISAPTFCNTVWPLSPCSQMSAPHIMLIRGCICAIIIMNVLLCFLFMTDDFIVYYLIVTCGHLWSWNICYWIMVVLILGVGGGSVVWGMCRFGGWAVDPISFLNHLFFCIFSMCLYWPESFEMLHMW